MPNSFVFAVTCMLLMNSALSTDPNLLLITNVHLYREGISTPRDIYFKPRDLTFATNDVLTENGKRMMYLLGAQIRETYKNRYQFDFDSYNKRLFAFSSVSSSESMQSFMEGLLPQGSVLENRGEQIDPPYKGFQRAQNSTQIIDNIRLSSINDPLANLDDKTQMNDIFMSDPAIECHREGPYIAMTRFMVNNFLGEKINFQIEELENLGFNRKLIKDENFYYQRVFRHLETIHALNYGVNNKPVVTKEIHDKIRLMASYEMQALTFTNEIDQSLYFDYTTQTSTLVTTALSYYTTLFLNEVIREVDRSYTEDTKQYLVASIDTTTLYALYVGLGLTNQTCINLMIRDNFSNLNETNCRLIPSFGESVTFEFLQSTSGDKFVKMVINGEETAIPVCGFKKLCPYDQFLINTEYNLHNPNFYKLCAPKTTQEVIRTLLKQEARTFFLVVIPGGILLMCGILAGFGIIIICCCQVRESRLTSYIELNASEQQNHKEDPNETNMDNNDNFEMPKVNNKVESALEDPRGRLP